MNMQLGFIISRMENTKRELLLTFLALIAPMSYAQYFLEKYTNFLTVLLLCVQ